MKVYEISPYGRALHFSVSCYNWVSSDIFNKQIVFGMGKSL